MAGIAGGRGGGRTRQSRYSTAVKSGVNSQEALFILMRVPIPISKVRYRKGATATYLSHCHRYRRRGRLATTEGEECRVRDARKPMGKQQVVLLHRIPPSQHCSLPAVIKERVLQSPHSSRHYVWLEWDAGFESRLCPLTTNAPGGTFRRGLADAVFSLYRSCSSIFYERS